VEVRQISRLLTSLTPGRVPHVRGLSRTWVEHDLFPMLSPPGLHLLTGKERGGASPGFPVEFGGVGEPHAAFLTESRTRCRWRVPRITKSGSPILFNPCTRKSANMGHPSRGKAWWEAGKAEDEMPAPPNRAKVVHFSFNSPSASQLLRDDKKRRVECCGIPLKPKPGLTPISCHAVLERSACAPFIKERRMGCINATSLHRKSGQWGTQPSLTVKQSKKVTTSRP
jgi:hypothetical protein